MVKIRLVSILFFVACICSCQRGRPARRQLGASLTTLPEIGATLTPYPSRWSLNSLQSSPNYLFYSTDTSLLTNGIRHNFLVLGIPDPAQDSTIGSLIASGQSLTPYLLTELHQQNKAGLIIDLRSSEGSPTIRRDYLINSGSLNETNLPIIFLWDQNSAGRAVYFTQYLEQFPGISWSISNGQQQYQSDCFKDVRPNF